MKRPYAGISGVVLAGGRNSRMGRHKAFIKINSERIIDRTLKLFSCVFEEIIIATDDKDVFKEFGHVAIAEDAVKDRGPLGGIYTALQSMKSEKGFFTACDMPFLHIGFIRRLTEYSVESDADCVIPYTDGGIEPLCGVYSRKIIPALEDSLNKGELSIRQLLKKCDCKYVKALEEEAASFSNINTREDLKRIKSHESKI